MKIYIIYICMYLVLWLWPEGGMKRYWKKTNLEGLLKTGKDVLFAPSSRKDNVELRSLNRFFSAIIGRGNLLFFLPDITFY